MKTIIQMRPDLAIVMRNVESLIPYENNARVHPKRQLKKLMESISVHNIINPLIIDEKGMVLCGHGRLEAAKALGMREVPTIMLEHMSLADKRAYIIADNALAEQAEWDRSKLAREFESLLELNYDLDQTGFDTLEIDSLLVLDDTATAAPADDVVHLPDESRAPLCRAGDLWHIGKHRLFVGDARDRVSYEALMGAERADLVFADPPYGCKIANNVSGNGKVRHQDFAMGCEGVGPELSMDLLRPTFRAMLPFVEPGAIGFICSDWRAAPAVQDAAEGVFEELKNLIIWVKSNAGQGSFYRSAYEMIFAYKLRAGNHINNFGLRRHRSNVWQYAGANTFRKGRAEDLADHPTVKPKALVADAILDCSKPGGIVLDSFAGSGTTLVAAEMTKRRGYGIELDPVYADVILKRVAKACGEEPLLNGAIPIMQVARERGIDLVEG